jgi:hypothetical protein
VEVHEATDETFTGFDSLTRGWGFERFVERRRGVLGMTLKVSVEVLKTRMVSSESLRVRVKGPGKSRDVREFAVGRGRFFVRVVEEGGRGGSSGGGVFVGGVAGDLVVGLEVSGEEGGWSRTLTGGFVVGEGGKDVTGFEGLDFSTVSGHEEMLAIKVLWWDDVKVDGLSSRNDGSGNGSRTKLELMKANEELGKLQSLLEEQRAQSHQVTELLKEEVKAAREDVARLSGMEGKIVQVKASLASLRERMEIESPQYEKDNDETLEKRLVSLQSRLYTVESELVQTKESLRVSTLALKDASIDTLSPLSLIAPKTRNRARSVSPTRSRMGSMTKPNEAVTSPVIISVTQLLDMVQSEIRSARNVLEFAASKPPMQFNNPASEAERAAIRADLTSTLKSCSSFFLYLISDCLFVVVQAELEVARASMADSMSQMSPTLLTSDPNSDTLYALRMEINDIISQLEYARSNLKDDLYIFEKPSLSVNVPDSTAVGWNPELPVAQYIDQSNYPYQHQQQQQQYGMQYEQQYPSTSESLQMSLQEERIKNQALLLELENVKASMRSQSVNPQTLSNRLSGVLALDTTPATVERGRGKDFPEPWTPYEESNEPLSVEVCYTIFIKKCLEINL